MLDGLRAWVAASDPTSWTSGIVSQGPWAAATCIVCLVLARLAWDVIKHERKRAEAAEARAEKLEEDYREKVVPVLTDVYRILADLARERRG